MLHKTFRNLQRSKIKLNAKMYLKCIKTYLLRLQKRKKLKKKKSLKFYFNSNISQHPSNSSIQNITPKSLFNVTKFKIN